MTLVARKTGGNRLRFDYNDGAKAISWVTDAADVSIDTLADIIMTVTGGHTVTGDHHQAATHDMDGEELLAQIALSHKPQFVQPPLFDTPNPGEAAADRAARDEETRLKNMGGALRTGVNLGPEDIPVFNNEAGDSLPPVNWGV